MTGKRFVPLTTPLKKTQLKQFVEGWGMTLQLNGKRKDRTLTPGSTINTLQLPFMLYVHRQFGLLVPQGLFTICIGITNACSYAAFYHVPRECIWTMEHVCTVLWIPSKRLKEGRPHALLVLTEPLRR